MDFYQCEKIYPNVTKITDLTNVYAYLVEGSQRALLIDTCTGIGDLQSVVDDLTSLPYSVVCTHGHVDHAGGSFGFEEVYLNPKDLKLAKLHTKVLFRKASLRAFASPDSIPQDAFVPQRKTPYLDLRDGQQFDLGGLTVEALAMPGHTQGMTCMLINELRTVLLGDGCNSFTFLFGRESSSVKEYQLNLKQFLRHEERFDTVLFSHGNYKGSKSILHECIELCDEIMTGKTDNVPFTFFGQKALQAKALTPQHARADGKSANIIFNPHKIF